jgi:hypothetical protein
MNKVIEFLKKWAGTITSCAAAIAVLYGLFSFVHTTKETNTKLHDFIDVKFPTYENVTTARLDTLEASVKNQKIIIVNIDNKVDNLSRSYTQYLINDKTLSTSEFYGYMEDMFGLTKKDTDKINDTNMLVKK